MLDYTYHDFLAYMGIGGAHPGGIALTEEIVAMTNINQQHHILDAGCGTGQTSAYLANTCNCKVTGVDTHPLMIEKAKQRFTKEKLPVSLIEANVENLPFKDHTFDVIVAESVTVFTNIEQTLAEFHRLLKPGGVVVDLEMTAKSTFPNDAIQQFNNLYGIAHVPLQEDWEKHFRKARFSSIEVIKQDLVSQQLSNSSSHEKTIEYNVSDEVDPRLYQIGHEHQLLTEKYSDQLKYHVYKATKNYE